MTPQTRSMEATFKALADTTRLRILGLLMTGEVCVCHLQTSLRTPQPKVSRHLAYLRRAGLVEARKEGLWNYYRLASPLDPMIQTLLASATHCLNHLESTDRDRARLQRATGRCSDVEVMPLSGCACCEDGRSGEPS